MSDQDPDPQENTQPIPAEPSKQSASPAPGPQSSKDAAGERTEKARRHPKKKTNKFTNRTEVARAMEQLMAMMMSGHIDAEEMRALLLLLKSISDQLPKGGPVGTTSISDRLRAKLKGDDELLNDLADLLPGDLLDDLINGSQE